MKSLRSLLVLLAFASFGCAPHLGAKRIDATSIETILASLEGQPKEDAALIKALVCHSADEFDSQGAQLQAQTLDRIRPRLHGRTVREVAAEITIQQNAAKESLKRSAERVVRENRAKWRERAVRYHLVQPGVAQSQVIELMGEPDAKADSPVLKNWLYRYDAAFNDDQIWIATLIVTFTDGVVSKAEQRDERRSIEAVTKAVK